MKKMQSFPLSVLSLAMLAAFQSAQADENEIAALTKPESSISLGLGHWTNGRPQQGSFDGMRDRGVFGNVDVDIVKRDDDSGTWISVTGRNLGLDTREARVEYLRQGNIGASIEYSRIPKDDPLFINSSLQGIGTTNQTVSGSGTGPQFPLTPVQLGTTRDLTTLGFYKNIMSGLDLNVTFKNEDKEGSRHWSRGGKPEFAAEPIDSNTRQLEAVLSYFAERWQLSGGYYGSWYDNANGLVKSSRSAIVNTAGRNQPVVLGQVADDIYLSLPLDNQAHQLFVDGGFNFTPTTRGTFKLQYSHATQDEHLPTKDISGLSLAASPNNLSGELNTTLAQAALTSRLSSDLSVLASVRYHDLQDDTPVARFVQSNAACGSGQCVDNTPFSFTTLTGKAEANYRLADGYSVNGGVEYRLQDRTVPISNANGTGGTDTQRVVPFRAEVEDMTYRLEGRRSLSETLNGSVAYLHTEREGSPYVLAGSGPGGAPSDRINPIHIADRTRDKLRLAIDWMPIEAATLQFVVEASQDEYSRDAVRAFGLEDGEGALTSIDASYKINDDWQMLAWYAYDQTKATQIGYRDSDGSIKTARLQDTGNSLGLGVRGKLMSRVAFGADLQWTRNESEYPETIATVAGAPVANTSLPDIESKLAKLNLFAEYEMDARSTWRFDFIHERWESNDWSWRFANGAPFTYTGEMPGSGTSAGIPFTDGTTVAAAQKQVSNFVGARYIHKF